MKRNERRAVRIRTDIPIEQVLASYGYEVQAGADRREQQFSCDLHGDGRDSKPSARCYPESNQWYCWACATSRDAVGTVREKEGVTFGAALEILERRYRLPPMPWEDEDREEGPRDALEGAFQTPVKSPGEEQTRLLHLIQSFTTERALPAPVLASWWERVDYLNFLLSSGLVAEWEQGLWEFRSTVLSGSVPAGGALARVG